MDRERRSSEAARNRGARARELPDPPLGCRGRCRERPFYGRASHRNRKRSGDMDTSRREFCGTHGHGISDSPRKCRGHRHPRGKSDATPFFHCTASPLGSVEEIGIPRGPANLNHGLHRTRRSLRRHRHTNCTGQRPQWMEEQSMSNTSNHLVGLLPNPSDSATRIGGVALFAGVFLLFMGFKESSVGSSKAMDSGVRKIGLGDPGHIRGRWHRG